MYEVVWSDYKWDLSGFDDFRLEFNSFTDGVKFAKNLGFVACGPILITTSNGKKRYPKISRCF